MDRKTVKKDYDALRNPCRIGRKLYLEIGYLTGYEVSANVRSTLHQVDS